MIKLILPITLLSFFILSCKKEIVEEVIPEEEAVTISETDSLIDALSGSYSGTRTRLVESYSWILDDPDGPSSYEATYEDDFIATVVHAGTDSIAFYPDSIMFNCCSEEKLNLFVLDSVVSFGSKSAGSGDYYSSFEYQFSGPFWDTLKIKTFNGYSWGDDSSTGYDTETVDYILMKD